jgi:ATP-dependent DNA helicase RecQ
VNAPDGVEGFLRKAQLALADVFGYPSFREGQLRALEAVAQHKDALVVMPTGSGKSLCYQVPALISEGTTLVVSPLIALMKDQVDALRMRDMPVAFINSTQTVDEQWGHLERLRAGAYRLVYVAPERMRSAAFRRALSSARISMLAVDEAHCISEWGHDFRPDYRRLKELRALLSGVPAMALTATATPEVQEDIVRELAMAEPVRVLTGFERPNLSFRVRKVRGSAEKHRELEAFLREQAQQREGQGPAAGIIYAGTRKHAEEAAEFVAGLEIPGAEHLDGPLARAYHAGLEDDVRREVQEDFMEGRLPVVAATNAFGMGVDKADIRFVVHFDMPGSIEAYYQEVGRAGRDGAPAECVLLFAEHDRGLQEFFIEGANPSRETIEGVDAFLWSLRENPVFRSLVELEGLFQRSASCPGKVNPLAFRSAVVVLERAGALERLDHYQNLAEAAPAAGACLDANPFGERAHVKHAVWEALRQAFERSEGDPVPFQVEHWAAEIGVAAESLRKTLSELERDGVISYTPPFRGRAIRLPRTRRSLKEIGVDFAALKRKRQRDEARLEQMVALAHSRECRRNVILGHFGQKPATPRCGNCDRCRRGPKAGSRPSAERELSEAEFTLVRKVLSGVARAKGRCNERRIAQMLIGSTARDVSELGLDQLSTFGLLKELRRDCVRQILADLEEAGCVTASRDRRDALHLTELGVRVMKGEARVELALADEVRAAAAVRPAAPESPAAAPLAPEDEDLFQRLRHLRREIAERLQIQAYRVFHDRTLRIMAHSRPSTAEELLRVPGVGTYTLRRFGREFLAEIAGRKLRMEE